MAGRRALAARLSAAAVGPGLVLGWARSSGNSAIEVLGLVALSSGLMLVWRAPRARGAAATGFVAGLFYFAIVVSWTWYFGTVAIVPLVLVLAASWALIGAIVAALARRGLQSPWLTAAVWVMVEAVTARTPLHGFSWGELGYGWHSVAPVRALAALGGLPLLTFATVACAAALADLFVAVSTRARAAAARAGACLAAIVLFTLGWYAVQPVPVPHGRLAVALLQANTLDRDLTDAEAAARYLPAQHFALADSLGTRRFDLMVLPESSLDEDPRRDPYLGSNLARIARAHDSYVLANAVADAEPGSPDGRLLNLDVLYTPGGRVAGTYAKRHLVPFGEYIPMRWLFGKIKATQQVARDFRAGTAPGLFALRGQRIGTIICFENAFGFEVRPLVRDGATVIVVSTNNRSYRRSNNAREHVAISQIRAVETGRPVVHASISGITALIDAHGDVLTRTRLFERRAVTGTVVATTGTTPYVRLGEWVPIGSLLAVAACAVVGIVARRRRSVDSGTSAAGPAVTAAADPSGTEARA